jgi:hypothetical protein
MKLNLGSRHKNFVVFSSACGYVDALDDLNQAIDSTSALFLGGVS